MILYMFVYMLGPRVYGLLCTYLSASFQLEDCVYPAHCVSFRRVWVHSEGCGSNRNYVRVCCMFKDRRESPCIPRVRRCVWPRVHYRNVFVSQSSSVLVQGLGGVTVTFWDALAQVPRGAGSLAPRPPTPGRSLAVGAMTSWGSQTETPAPGGEREVLSVTPGFVTSSPTHLAAGASWPLQPGAEC